MQTKELLFGISQEEMLSVCNAGEVIDSDLELFKTLQENHTWLNRASEVAEPALEVYKNVLLDKPTLLVYPDATQKIQFEVFSPFASKHDVCFKAVVLYAGENKNNLVPGNTMSMTLHTSDDSDQNDFFQMSIPVNVNGSSPVELLVTVIESETGRVVEERVPFTSSDLNVERVSVNEDEGWDQAGYVKKAEINDERLSFLKEAQSRVRTQIQKDGRKVGIVEKTYRKRLERLEINVLDKTTGKPIATNQSDLVRETFELKEGHEYIIVMTAAAEGNKPKLVARAYLQSSRDVIGRENLSQLAQYEDEETGRTQAEKEAEMERVACANFLAELSLQDSPSEISFSTAPFGDRRRPLDIRILDPKTGKPSEVDIINRIFTVGFKPADGEEYDILLIAPEENSKPEVIVKKHIEYQR